MAASANVTKYQAGGSGDNYIPDGYIKAVEKLWVDSYTIAFTNTNTTIDIAVLTPNKKVLGIDLEIETTASQTNGTISIGFSSDALAAGSHNAFLAPTTISHNLTRTSLRLPGPGIISQATATSSTIFVGTMGGFQKVLDATNTTITVKLNNWTMTSGTMKTIVRYT